MAISIQLPPAEKRLDRIASSRFPRTTKKALAEAIIDRASRMCHRELYRWLNDDLPSVADADDDGVPSSKSATSKHSDSAHQRQEK